MLVSMTGWNHKRQVQLSQCSKIAHSGHLESHCDSLICWLADSGSDLVALTPASALGV